MNESILRRSAANGLGNTLPRAMAACPMAKMCERMMDKPHSGALFMLPGALLIALGVLLVLEPRILVWLIAAFTVLLGIMLLMMGRFVGRLHKPWTGR